MMQWPPDDTIHMLETLDLTACTRHVQVSVDWFRAIHHYDVPNHTWHEHTSVEIHFVANGSVRFNLPGRTVDVMSGQAILIPPNTPHQLQNQSNQIYYRYVLKFSMEPRSDDPEATFLINALHAQKPQVISIYGRVLDLLDDCLHEAVERINGFMTAIEIDIMAILTAVARELTHSAKAAYPVREKVNADMQRMRQVMSLLEADDISSITAEELSQQVFLSPRQLQRIVARQSGMTLRELMMRTRYKRAKELLKNPDISIAEIAQRMGFASQQSFNRFFRKMEGEPPASYRSSAVSGRVRTVPQNVAKIDDKEMLP